MDPYTEIGVDSDEIYNLLMETKTMHAMFCTQCGTVHQFTNVQNVHGLDTVAYEGKHLITAQNRGGAKTNYTTAFPRRHHC